MGYDLKHPYRYDKEQLLQMVGTQLWRLWRYEMEVTMVHHDTHMPGWPSQPAWSSLTVCVEVCAKLRWIGG